MRVLEHVAALDLCPDAVNLLVDDWHSLANGAPGRVQHEHALARREIEAVARTACKEAYVLVCLAAIRLEVQRQLAVGLAYSSFRSRGCWTSEADEEWEQHEHSARRVPGHDYLSLVFTETGTTRKYAAPIAEIERPQCLFWTRAWRPSPYNRFQ